MKHVLSQMAQERIAYSVIQVLADNNCTLANYEEIHELVIKHYKNNAMLPNFDASGNYTENYFHSKGNS